MLYDIKWEHKHKPFKWYESKQTAVLDEVKPHKALYNVVLFISL